MAHPLPDARELLGGLIGRTITTVTGRPNTVLEIGESEVIVATGRSPRGTVVPIDWVQDALDRLASDGEIEVSVDSLVTAVPSCQRCCLRCREPRRRRPLRHTSP